MTYVFQVNYLVLRSSIRTLLVAFTNAPDKPTAISKVQNSVQAPDTFLGAESVLQLDAMIIP